MDERKQKHKRGFLHTAVFLLLLLFSCTLPASATEETKEKMEEAERKKEEKQNELEAAQAELARTEDNLAALQVVKSGYQGEMDVLNEEMQLVADQLAVLETKIDLKQMEIDETRAALMEASETRLNQYESMKMRIRFLYESGGTTYVDLLLSAESFGEFLNYADYIDQLSAYDRRMLEEYVATEKAITETAMRLDQEMAELDELQANVAEQQGRVSGLIDKTAQKIAATVDSIEDVTSVADAIEEQVDAREQEVADATAEYEAIKAKYEEELRLSRLAAQSAWRDISQVTFEEGDRYLLANLIYCEAGGEPYEGQVAVGAVVINRVLSSVYPDTVTGVIYQRSQFSPVQYGSLAAALAVNRATDSCYRAADEAMSGRTNVGNCVYFRTPIPGLEGIRIGGHIFY
ncbi:MAG: cell wall hydrolase [Lachnospiraceae bacterium]|nr:cell wall hydrolase [Lachnospiraceae bacterium]